MNEFLSGMQTYLSESPFLALLAAFLGGVLSSYTPCVYPLFPIMVGVIGAKSAASRLTGFFLSLVYVLGMALTYAALGLSASLTGRFFGEVSTQPYVYLLVANIFILFGLSMMGVFDIQLPQWFLRRRSQSGSGKWMDVFLLGLTSGLVAAPCTVPVFGALLTFAALKQNVAFGFLLLFVFSLGMGVLLVVLGTFTGLLSSLPKAGVWQSRIKIAFGFFMLFIGEYFLIKMGKLLI